MQRSGQNERDGAVFYFGRQGIQCKTFYGQCRENVPHLCLVHAIIEDDIKERYHCHNETLTQYDFDALKPKINSLTDVYDLIVDC